MKGLKLGTNLALAAIFVSGTVFAQQPKKDEQTVARLVDVQGTVMVSGSGGTVPGANELRIAADTRLVTSAGSRVTIKYDRGCDIRLEEKSRFTVKESGECCALVDTVETSAGTNASALPAAKRPGADEFTVAKLTNLEGTVLVSEGDAMAAGTTDLRLKIDTRVVTTAASATTIAYDKGCDVRLSENQRFIIRDRGGCCALVAAVESIGAPVAAAAAGGISGLGILGVAGVGTAAVIGVGRTSGANVSPN